MSLSGILGAEQDKRLTQLFAVRRDRAALLSTDDVFLNITGLHSSVILNAHSDKMSLHLVLYAFSLPLRTGYLIV